MLIADLVPPPPEDSIKYFVVAVSFFSRCKQTG